MIKNREAYVKAIVGTVWRPIWTSGVMDFEDSVQDGQLGFCKAERDFKDSGGAQFESYAYRRIRGECIDGLRRIAGRIKDGHAYKGRATAELVTLDAPVAMNSDDKEMTLQDFLKSNEPEPNVEVESVEIHELLHEAMGRLSRRKQLIVSFYYFEDLTLLQIAQIFELSDSRISQLLQQARDEMRRYILRKLHPESARDATQVLLSK